MSKTQGRLKTGPLLAVLAVVVSGAVLGACVENPPPSGASADVAVSVTIDDSTPHYGQDVLLTTVVQNLGADTATGVSVTVSLPAGLGYVDPSSGDTSGTVTWPIGQLAASADTTLTLHVTAGDVALGDQVVSASVQAMTSDPVAGNNTDSLTEHSIPAPVVLSLVPDPTNPTFVDISGSGSVGWSASLKSGVGPSAPAPQRSATWLTWQCSSDSLNPCPTADALVTPNLDALTFEVSQFQVDIYTITLVATVSDPNFESGQFQTSVSFTTANSGG